MTAPQGTAISGDAAPLLQRAADLAATSAALGTSQLATQLAITEHLAETRGEQLAAANRRLDAVTAELERIRVVVGELETALASARGDAGEVVEAEVVDDATEDDPGEG